MMNLILPYLIIGMVFSVVFAFFIAKIGEKREIGKTTAFIVSVLLGPLLGLIIVLSSDELPKRKRKKRKSDEPSPILSSNFSKVDPLMTEGNEFREDQGEERIEKPYKTNSKALTVLGILLLLSLFAGIAHSLSMPTYPDSRPIVDVSEPEEMPAIEEAVAPEAPAVESEISSYEETPYEETSTYVEEEGEDKHVQIRVTDASCGFFKIEVVDQSGNIVWEEENRDFSNRIPNKLVFSKMIPTGHTVRVSIDYVTHSAGISAYIYVNGELVQGDKRYESSLTLYSGKSGEISANI